VGRGGVNLSSLPAGTASVSFSYTGRVQNFTVPLGVNSINVVAVGASGGSSAGCPSGSSYAGGSGGGIAKLLTVVQLQTYYIYVGGSGSSISSCVAGSGGFNGGGSAMGYGGGGGGATDIRSSYGDVSTRYSSYSNSIFQDFTVIL
jgi:hypothetical protein